MVNDDSKYRLCFRTIESNEIARQKLCILKSSRNFSIATYTVCKQCYCYLKKEEGNTVVENAKRKNWENTWPSFYRDLLFGKQKTDGRQFHDICGASKLWQLVPETIRPFWKNRLETFEMNGVKPYALCIEESTPSVFDDRTDDIDFFWSSIKSYQLVSWLAAFSCKREQPIALPNVLCPWGCSEFCFRAKPYNAAIVIQHYLSEVQLNFPDSKWYKILYVMESSRLDYLRPSHDYDTILMNKKWKVLPSIVMDEKGTPMVLMCRHHYKHSDMKHLHMHPPRKPYHNLSPERADQLSHAIVQAATLQTTRSHKFCSSFRMHTQESSWAGIDTFTVGTCGNFGGNNMAMLGEAASLSLKMRNDIKSLAAENVKEEIMTPEYLQSMEDYGKHAYPDDLIMSLIHGSTYVPIDDAIDLQMDSTQDENVLITIHKNARNSLIAGTVTTDVMSAKKSWLPMINYVQIEDLTRYGYPMKAIEDYTSRVEQQPTMMLWSLIGCMVSCKELWRVVDQQPENFNDYWWDAYVLTHITWKYLKHAQLANPKAKTP